jgi:putative ABC transport system substrate-binding protein
LTAKRIQLIRQIVPNSKSVAILINPNNPDARAQSENATQAADSIGERIQIVKAGTQEEINHAFSELSQQTASCLVVANDAFFTSTSQQIASAASKFHVPAVYPFREFAAAGGLLSYATKLADAYHDAGSYAARILKGAKPTDLPVLQPTKFDLVINQRTAKALGLTIPPDLLALADEVIE